MHSLRRFVVCTINKSAQQYARRIEFIGRQQLQKQPLPQLVASSFSTSSSFSSSPFISAGRVSSTSPFANATMTKRVSPHASIRSQYDKYRRNNKFFFHQHASVMASTRFFATTKKAYENQKSELATPNDADATPTPTTDSTDATTTTTKKARKKPAMKQQEGQQEQEQNASPDTTTATEDVSETKPKTTTTTTSSIDTPEGLRAKLDEVAPRLKIVNFPEDWYRIKPAEVNKHAGRDVLKRYKTVYEALSTAYPEVEWLPWRFKAGGAPSSYFDDIEVHKKYFAWLAKQLNIKEDDDWYTLRMRDVVEFDGEQIMKRYDNSLPKALSAVYPHTEWYPWNFPTLPMGFWDDINNQRWFFDTVAKRLHVDSPEGWYKVGVNDLKQHGGGGLLRRYRDQLFVALNNVYPWDLKPWKFILGKPKSYSSLENRYTTEDYVAHVILQHNFRDLANDWYRLYPEQVKELGGWSILNRAGGLIGALRHMYPDVKWDKRKFHVQKANKLIVRTLWLSLRRLFPNQELLDEYEHPELQYKTSYPGSPEGEKMDFDFYLPQLKLAIDFHGEHHADPLMWGPQAERDKEKAQACAEAGITFITVPHWWDKTQESLAATIHSVRPELIEKPTTAQPIPAKRPDAVDKSLQHPTSGDKVMLACAWKSRLDPTGWWMCEKLDGIRAYWDGEKLYTKNNKQLLTPPGWLDGLPKDIPLDGELWIGHGQLPAVSTITENPEGPGWDVVKYVVFDLPNDPGTYEQRREALTQLDLPRHVPILPIIMCQGRDHLKTYLHEIVHNRGGEGVMLNKPGSLYERGRSSNLLKVKLKQDAEVLVKEKMESVWGLLCEQPDGQDVVVQCSSATYAKPPEPGTIITVLHNGFLKSGKFRTPYFYRVRKDVEWQDVVRDFEKNKFKMFDLTMDDNNNDDAESPAASQ